MSSTYQSAPIRGVSETIMRGKYGDQHGGHPSQPAQPLPDRCDDADRTAILRGMKVSPLAVWAVAAYTVAIIVAIIAAIPLDWWPWSVL